MSTKKLINVKKAPEASVEVPPEVAGVSAVEVVQREAGGRCEECLQAFSPTDDVPKHLHLVVDLAHDIHVSGVTYKAGDARILPADAWHVAKYALKTKG